MEGRLKSTGLGEWLQERCQRESLSLRQAGAKAGLSHATIRDIVNGNAASPTTIRKLARAFGGDGQQELAALEDKLLTLAGYRGERPEVEISETMGRLLDRIGGFSESQLKMMERFADFMAEMTEKAEKAEMEEK